QPAEELDPTPRVHVGNFKETTTQSFPVPGAVKQVVRRRQGVTHPASHPLSSRPRGTGCEGDPRGVLAANPLSHLTPPRARNLGSLATQSLSPRLAHLMRRAQAMPEDVPADLPSLEGARLLVEPAPALPGL